MITFIPVLAYTLFLLLFLNVFVLPFLPPRLHTLARYGIGTAIPLIITFEQLSSLLGMAYGLIPSSSILAQGYTSPSAETISHTLSVISLVLLIAVQATTVALCSLLIYHMERIHKLGGAIPGTYPKATKFLCGGVALGTIDSLIGLAGETFGSILTRRLLEGLSRTLIIYALVSQAASRRLSLGISNVPSSKSKGKKPSVRNMISNPRFSTFAHLNGPSSNALYDIGADDTRGTNPKRVTVSYDRVNPPTLEMRFSALSITVIPTSPPRATVRPMQSIEEGMGIAGMGLSASTRSVKSRLANPSLYAFRPEYFAPLTPQPEVTTAAVSTASMEERRVSESGSVEDVRELAAVRVLTAQFPRTPQPSESGALEHRRKDPFADAGESFLDIGQDEQEDEEEQEQVVVTPERGAPLKVVPAELAPSTVFRDRFAGQRLARRQSQSKQGVTVGTQARWTEELSVSPPPLPVPAPILSRVNSRRTTPSPVHVVPRFNPSSANVEHIV